ncbi:MAG: hypothetical protein AAGC68_10120, partial [Verrucomicrobiota bacterium]
VELPLSSIFLEPVLGPQARLLTEAMSEQSREEAQLMEAVLEELEGMSDTKAEHMIQEMEKRKAEEGRKSES